MTAIASNLQAVNQAIDEAARTAGRHREDIALLAVSKTVHADALREAYQSGQCAFGESYIQEALGKMEALHDLPLQWHFIGPIQSNKTRAIAENFQWVHGVDRLKVAERLSAQRPPGLPLLNVCIQVNVSGESSKSGVTEEDAPGLATAVSRLPGMRLRGLMAIPAPAEAVSEQRKPFSRLRTLMDRINRQGFMLDTLSMGMSHDFAAAIQEGATIVRIGTAIFGQRPQGGGGE